MSCGRNRRRPKLPLSIDSRLHSQQEKSLAQSTEKKYQSLRNRKSNCLGNLSKQTSHESTNDFDRFRILDEQGNDVTPRRITDYIRINMRSRDENEKSISETINKRIIDNQEQSISDKSLVGTTNLTTSTSHMIHTNTLFSTGENATLDIGRRIIFESEHLLSRTHKDRASRVSSENEEIQAKFLPGLGLQWTDLLTDNVMLSETETIFILDRSSTVVSLEDNEEYNKINEKNNLYIEICKNERGNDLYIERGMQTFNNLPKHEHIITDPVLIRTQQSWANSWDIHDSIIEANQYEAQIYRQYVLLNNKDSNDRRVKSDEYQFRHTSNTIVSDNSSKISSSQNSSALISQESLVKMTPSKSNCFELDDNTKNKLPEIDVDVFIMERILNSNVHYMKQAIYRSFNTILHTSQDKDVLSIKNTKLSLERLWYYSCYLTQGRNVSCLCWNAQNHAVLAVGYGKFQYNDDREGLVCCWNAKNLEFPERYYQTDAGVTSLSFSLKRPNLLAVGLFNGNICVFDLNENNTSPIVDTSEYDKKHTNPVWQLAWIEHDRSSKMDNIEVLVSISSDGCVTQWILRKEFEAIDFMHLKPYNSSQTTCQSLESSDGTYSNRHFSGFVGGLCFDIRSNDKTIFLCGTDDGLIHRCSTIYNEKYLESYIGHTGPVYKVHWSPFSENIFLSASADWTVRLWMVGYNQPCMIFSSTTSKIFFDAIWSPKSSTIFCCVSENTIEIWDLSKSILDPIYVANCTNQLTLTSIAYATDSDCILVGTNDGAVWVYRLENFSSSSDSNDLLTIVEQTLVGQLDSLENTNIHQQISLTSIKSTAAEILTDIKKSISIYARSISSRCKSEDIIHSLELSMYKLSIYLLSFYKINQR